MCFGLTCRYRHSRAGSEGKGTRSLPVAYHDARSALRLSGCYWMPGMVRLDVESWQWRHLVLSGTGGSRWREGRGSSNRVPIPQALSLRGWTRGSSKLVSPAGAWLEMLSWTVAFSFVFFGRVSDRWGGRWGAELCWCCCCCATARRAYGFLPVVSASTAERGIRDHSVLQSLKSRVGRETCRPLRSANLGSSRVEE